MRCFSLVVFAVFLATDVLDLPAQNPKLVADTEPLTAEEQLTKFHLPPGFRIELIAAEPECRKPMNLKFDAAGRLWFTQSIEYPWPVKEGETGRDTIRVMTDTNNDGVPDKTDVFAEGLNIPIGITPVSGGVLGYSIPTLHYFPDADGDGKADSRREYYGSFGFRDTHGMCSSLNEWVDGWIYGCHGFSNESTVAGQDGTAIKMQSGNTYRLRADGSHIEYVTHGQVNPFGMTFDPLGNQFTSDCHTKPAYMLIRGAYYPSFGKPHDGLGFAPELMQHLHGSTGIAGVVYYAAEHFPPEFRDNLFIGNPVTGRINRDTLDVTGSTYKAVEQPDFLWCDDEWFRPVDLQLAPDGSLYIADFYNRIIGHYEVPLTHPGRDRERGRIWRISYVGEDGLVQAPRIPDLTKATMDALIEHLGHPHLPVRVMATNQLVNRMGEPALLPALAALKSDSALRRAHALWVVERLRGLANDEVLALAQDKDRLVRVHLIKALAERVTPGAMWDRFPVALQEDPDAFVRRAAAEAIGRHPSVQELGAALLLKAWRSADPKDAVLVHTIKIATRDAIVTRDLLTTHARDAMLTPEDRDHVVEVALGIPTAASADFLLTSASIRPWPRHLAEPAIHLVGRYLDRAKLADYLALISYYQSEPAGAVVPLVRAYHRAAQERGEPPNASVIDWACSVATSLLGNNNIPARRQGLELIRDLKLVSAAMDLPSWLDTTSAPEELRPLVLDALGAVNHPQLLESVATLLSDDTVNTGLKQHAAQIAGSTNSPEARELLRARLKTAPYSQALGLARGLAGTGPGGVELLTALEKGEASPRLLQDATLDQRLKAARVENYEDRKARLLAGLPEENEALKQLVNARREGFAKAELHPENGLAVYKKVCASCHRLRNEGGKVGPELDGVGLRGLERLLEDTLDPNRNVDAAFRASTLVLANGQVLNGLVLREEGEVLVMVNDQGQEQPIALKEIDERNQTPLSPMPANIADKLTEVEYYDLLAFLLQQRTGKSAPAN